MTRINVTDCPLLKSGVGGKFNKSWTLYRVIGTDSTGSALADNVVSFKFLANGAYDCELVPNDQHGSVQVRSPQWVGGGTGPTGAVAPPPPSAPTAPVVNDPTVPVTRTEYNELVRRVEALESWIRAFTNTGEVPA